MGIATTEHMGSFGRLRCELGHEQWKQNHVDVRESGWRLTLPFSRLDENNRIDRFLPADRSLNKIYALFGNLPDPHSYRPGQQGMGYSVALALRDNMTLLANAGVGIGKTFAYLLPSLSWLHVHSFDTIVIATRTILLQHQLMHDIETAQQILNIKVPVLLVKGQQQYLCMERLQEATESLTPELEEWRKTWLGQHEEAIQAQEVYLKTLTHTRYQGRVEASGAYRTVRTYRDTDIRVLAERSQDLPSFTADQIDRARFPHVPDALWSKIQVTPEKNCNACDIRHACGWYQLRQKRTQFHGLMVVNHGLLARDAHHRSTDVRDGLWPLPKAVIVDEAHALEDALRESGALPVRPSDIRRIFGRVVKILSKSALIDSRRTAYQLESVIPVLVKEISRSIQKSDDRARTTQSTFDVRAQSLCPTDGLKKALSICVSLRDTVEESMVLSHRQREEVGLPVLLQSLDRLYQWVVNRDRSPYVVWIDDKRVIQVGPLDLSVPMAAISRHATVLTSGTLGLQDNFSLLEMGLGLGALARGKVLRLYTPSPFDYPHQLSYQLVTNLPDPRDDQRSLVHRARETARSILALHATHARVLVLFTSKRFLLAVHQNLPDQAPVIYDGQGSPDELAREFRKASRIIYLSTAAWEGLDAPGPKAVVIVQLPYPVPSDPWLQAKTRNAKVQHCDEMARIIIPVMQLRMIQGTGRAVRRHDDLGTVIILDPRAPERFPQYLAPVLPDALTQLVTL